MVRVADASRPHLDHQGPAPFEHEPLARERGYPRPVHQHRIEVGMLIAFADIGSWVFRHGVQKEKRVSCQVE